MEDDEATRLITVGTGDYETLQGDTKHLDPRETSINTFTFQVHRQKDPVTIHSVVDVLKSHIIIICFAIAVAILLLICAIWVWPVGSDKGLTTQAWIAIITTCVALLFLMAEFYPASFVLFAASTFLLILNIISVDEAISGFSNSAVVAVGVLFVIAKAIDMSKALNYIIKYVLRKPSGLLSAQLRLLTPVAIFSIFMNNTPIVAMMIPVVERWSVLCNIPQSRLLMPLSYAAIMGGSCSLIGTSTNLIVASLAQKDDPSLHLGFFEIAYAGVPVLISGLIYIFIFSRFLLQVKTSPTEDLIKNQREYTACVSVRKDSEVIGKTISEAGLTDLDVSLFQINRKGTIISAPSFDVVLLEEDLLYFAGVIGSMQQVYSIPGLVPATNEVSKLKDRRSMRSMVEVVVSSSSPLIGQTVKEANFRERYSAAVIAIHRHGERINSRICEIQITAGDTLLLEASKKFLEFHKFDADFSLINQLTDYSVLGHYALWRMLFIVAATIGMVIASTLGVSLVTASFVVSCLFIITKSITMKQAFESIKWDLLLIIASAFGLGDALQHTGAAAALGSKLIDIFSIAGNIGILFGLYLSTAIMSSIISNAATVSLMWPIAYSFVEQSDGELNIKAVVYVLMLSGSCCFATPIGYQTNIMVSGPGGYTTSDFLKFGVPLTVVTMVVGVLMSYVVWQM